MSLRKIRVDAGARVLHHIDLYLFEQYGTDLPAYVRRQVDIELNQMVHSAREASRLKTLRQLRKPK